MVDEFKSIRNNLFKAIAGLGTADDEDEGDEEFDRGERGDGRSSTIDARAARALIGALFSKAGKGKDEIIQVVAHEIGVAVAAMLKEPLAQLAKHHKLQISFELVPKSGKEAPPAEPPSAPREPAKTGKPSPRSKKPGKGAV